MMVLLQTIAIDSVATVPAAVEVTTQSIGLVDLLIKTRNEKRKQIDQLILLLFKQKARKRKLKHGVGWL